MPAGLHLLLLVDWCYSSHIPCPIGLPLGFLKSRLHPYIILFQLFCLRILWPIAHFHFNFFTISILCLGLLFFLWYLIEILLCQFSSYPALIFPFLFVILEVYVELSIRKGFSTISEIIKPFSDFSVFCWCNFRSILRSKSTRNKFIGK